MGKAKAIYSELACSKGVGHDHLCLAETQRQAEVWANFPVEKRELRVPDGAGGLGGWGVSRRGGIPCDWSGSRWDLLGLVLSWKQDNSYGGRRY